MSQETKPRSKERKKKKRDSLQPNTTLQEYRAFLDQKNVVLENSVLFDNLSEDQAQLLSSIEASLKLEKPEALQFLKSAKKLLSCVKNGSIHLKHSSKEVVVKRFLFTAAYRLKQVISMGIHEVEATVKLGDVLTLLGCTFQDSTFELGVEYYQKAHNMKSSSYKELRKFGLHLNKQSELLSHSFFMHPSIDDLDELCNFCFVKSIIVKPAYLTRIMYMEVLTSRLQRTHSIYAIVELMDLVTQTALKGLDANSEKLDTIIKWASFLDHLITFYVPYYTFVEQSFKVCYYQFILSYRKVLMEKDLKREEINLEPLIAFSLVERIDYVHENAFDILISLSKSENSDLKNDAIKHVNHIKNIYKYRTKEVESNRKKISSYLKGLKDKTQIALWKKSHLTINDVSHDYNLFYTCMNICNAKRDTRKYKNPYEEEFKELVTQKNPFGGDYIMGSLIKETARTSVYTVESAGGKSFAMKVISATKSSIEFIMAMREIINLKKLSHPNIVKYSNAYYFSDQFFIVLEYCNAGNIMDMYKEVKLSVSDISFVMRELCQGVSYLHENNIAHLSLTTENMLLIGDGSFKIGGFGTVLNWTKDEIDKETIRLAVRSPEMLQGKAVNGKADVFALGVFCLELASRTRWNSQIKSDFQAEFLIGSCIIPEIISVNNTIDKSTKLMLDFISMAMHPNPMKRPTSAQLLSHPFLSIGNRIQIKTYLKAKIEVAYIGSSLSTTVF